MHLDNQIKLDFKDVLIRPKRSTLTSRSQVDITREIKFRWSPERFHAIPVIAANMDTTGTFEMARALGRHGMMTVLGNTSTSSQVSSTSPTRSIRWASATPNTNSSVP